MKKNIAIVILVLTTVVSMVYALVQQTEARKATVEAQQLSALAAKYHRDAQAEAVRAQHETMELRKLLDKCKTK